MAQSKISHQDLKFAGDIGRLEGKIDSAIGMITDVKTAQTQLSSDFNTMEKGRLTALEVKFASHVSEIDGKARVTGALWGTGAALFVAIISGLLLFYIKM